METRAFVELRAPVVQGSPARVHVGGEGPQTFLLLHGGWGDARTHWSRVWDRLAEHGRVVAPDLPGLGDPTVTGPRSVPAFVAWLEALLDALAVDRVVCVGNSFGASLAWSLAGRLPSRCAGVVLVDGMPMPRTPAPLLWLGRRASGRRLMRLLLRRVSFTPRALARAFADPSLAPAALGAELGDVPARRLETFVDCLVAGDGPPPPRAPVLVLWGEEDRLPRTSLAEGRAIAASIPGARFAALAHAGHFPQLERPEAFVEEVLRSSAHARG